MLASRVLRGYAKAARTLLLRAFVILLLMQNLKRNTDSVWIVSQTSQLSKSSLGHGTVELFLVEVEFQPNMF